VENELILDAVIRAHGYDYEVRVSFPSLFPEVPAVVRTLNAQQRLSQHQYGGPNGPLCLEWGPDNWHRDVTTVQCSRVLIGFSKSKIPLATTSPNCQLSRPRGIGSLRAKRLAGNGVAGITARG
jgi:hypothetical protein